MAGPINSAILSGLNYDGPENDSPHDTGAAGRNMPRFDPGKDKPKKPPVTRLAKAGRHGDTLVGHFSPHEAMILMALGGAGSVNPKTGFFEFFDIGDAGSPGERDNTEGGDMSGVGGVDGNAGARSNRESEDKSMAELDAMGAYGLGFGPLDGIIGNTSLGLAMRGVADLRGRAERAGMSVSDNTPGLGDPEGGGPNGDLSGIITGLTGAITPAESGPRRRNWDPINYRWLDYTS